MQILSLIQPKGNTEEPSPCVSGSQKYGESYGSIEISYEDVNGEKHFESQSVKMTIAEPKKITDEEKVK